MRAIAIADSNGNVVLSTDLHHAESMQFELTSIFDNTGNDAAAIGCVAVACQGGGVQFRHRMLAERLAEEAPVPGLMDLRLRVGAEDDPSSKVS